MVTKTRLLPVSLAIACMALIMIAPVAAQDKEQKREVTINEEYTVTVDEVGDAHIEDVLKYSAEDFKTMKKVARENPTLFSRRYRDESNTGEVVNFKTSLKNSDNSIMITFETPGYSYNMKDYWVAYGFGDKPKKTGAKGVTFEGESDVNSEFTLFTSQLMHTKSVIELPASATNVRYDEEAKAVKYDMPAAHSSLGFLSENKGWLSVLFGMLALVFALLLVLVWTREPREPVPAVRKQPPASVTAPPTSTGPRHCPQCGAGVRRGKKFCHHCGSAIT